MAKKTDALSHLLSAIDEEATPSGTTAGLIEQIADAIEDGGGSGGGAGGNVVIFENLDDSGEGYEYNYSGIMEACNNSVVAINFNDSIIFRCGVNIISGTSCPMFLFSNAINNNGHKLDFITVKSDGSITEKLITL